MLGGELLRDVPGADRRPGHPPADRVARDDEDAPPRRRREHAQVAHDLLVALEVGLDRVRGLVELAEEAEELAVAADARALHLLPRLRHRREVLDELVDGEDARHRRLRDRHLQRGVVAGLADVERGRVELAAGDRAAHGEEERPGEHRLEGLVVEVLVERVEGVPLEEVLLAEGAELVHRRVVLVVRERLRLEAEPVAQEVQAPAEVHVVVEHEVAVVEAAQLLEHLRPDEHRGAGAEEDVLLLVPAAAVALAGVRLVAHAVPGDGAVDEVDLLALPVEHLARDGADVAPGVEGGHRLRDPRGVRLGVVVEEGDVLAARPGDAEVAAAREAEVGARVDQEDVIPERLELLEAVVAGAVLDHDDLEPVGRPVELLQPAHGLDRVVRAPEVHQDDGHDSGASLLHRRHRSLAHSATNARQSTRWFWALTGPGRPPMP